MSNDNDDDKIRGREKRKMLFKINWKIKFDQ